MADHHVDRPEVEREQSPQLTGTNRSIGLIIGAATLAPHHRPRAAPNPPFQPGTGPRPPPRHFSPHTSPQGVHPKGVPKGVHPGSFAGLVAIARGQTPDPIPNSAVKTLSAHGTAAQAAEESVAARPAKPPTLSPDPPAIESIQTEYRGVEQPGSSSGS